MNAVIVDIRKKQAAALDETGRVVRIPNANYEIGQTIELHEIRPVRTPARLKRFSTGVAAAVLVAMIGTGTAYAMPYGTVTLDGDSSVEYTINCFDYVLDVKAANEEGATLLAGIDTRQLRHHRIDAAVAATVERMEPPTSIDSPEAELRIVTDTGNAHHTERLQQELEPLIEREPPVSAGGTSAPQMDKHMDPEDRPGPDLEQPPEPDEQEAQPPEAAREPFPDGVESREPDPGTPDGNAAYAGDRPGPGFGSVPAWTPESGNADAPQGLPPAPEAPPQ